MRTLNLQIIGTTPILLHQISRHELREQIASHRGASISIEDEALGIMMKDKDGNPAVPVSWLWDALRVGCSRITVEGKQVSFFKLKSVIQLPDCLIPLKDTDNHIPAWETYSSFQHAAPGSRKSIVVVAPMFKDWMITPIPVSISADLVLGNSSESEKLLKQIFVEAGRTGIGLFHPPKKHFGQFRVEIV